ncbi:29549_t:CDS:2, partial [Gigaspora margarita]
KPGDKGRDIICEVYGLTFVIQCKAWYKKNIDRSHVDELETVIRRGNNDLDTVVKKGRFSFGILVGVDICKISDEAIDRARTSECDIGVVTYHDMCKEIVWLSSRRLNEQALVLENRNREFKLDNN